MSQVGISLYTNTKHDTIYVEHYIQTGYVSMRNTGMNNSVIYQILNCYQQNRLELPIPEVQWYDIYFYFQMTKFIQRYCTRIIQGVIG